MFIAIEGLGCTRRSDETWLAFNDDYEAILKDLSKKNKTRMENVKAKHSDRKDSLHKMKSKTVTKRLINFVVLRSTNDRVLFIYKKIKH